MWFCLLHSERLYDISMITYTAPFLKGETFVFSVQFTARGLLPQARSGRFSPAILSLCFAPPGTPPCHCIFLYLSEVFFQRPPTVIFIIVGKEADCQSFPPLFLHFLDFFPALCFTKISLTAIFNYIILRRNPPDVVLPPAF